MAMLNNQSVYHVISCYILQVHYGIPMSHVIRLVPIHLRQLISADGARVVFVKVFEGLGPWLQWPWKIHMERA